jgi:hypothetical protein
MFFIDCSRIASDLHLFIYVYLCRIDNIIFTSHLIVVAYLRNLLAIVSETCYNINWKRKEECQVQCLNRC